MAISLAMTVRTLQVTWFATKIPRSDKKNSRQTVATTNWPLQVRESPLRHFDVPTVTQDQATRQARVLETSVEEEQS